MYRLVVKKCNIILDIERKKKLRALGIVFLRFDV